LPIPLPRLGEGGTLTGQVIRIDRFGNCITNIGRLDLEAFAAGAAESVRILLNGRPVGGLVQFFGEAGPGGHGAILGSTGRLELFAVQGNFARRWGVAPGAVVRLEKDG
jgi:S-adenosylmethionine hydrolase